MLAKHPHIQDKLRAEVSAASLPTDPSTAADPETDLAATLEQMPWLNGVINETLRLYPTVPATARQAIRDTRVGDQVIPRGTMLLICIWQINRSPDLWGPTSLEWHPERWIEPDGRPNQTGGMSSNYNFMTFLHGPRSCIGQGFARAEMRCLLATLVRSFRWELAMDEAKIIPRGVITIKPESGLYLKLTPIEEKA